MGRRQYLMANVVRFKVKNPHEVSGRILKAAHDIGRLVYDDSQVNVPVLTGELKASGRLRMNQDGFTIRYTAGHASKQEFGRDPGFTEHVEKHPVKRHKRRAVVPARAGSTMIPRHTYRKDGKLITVRRHRRKVQVPAGMRLEAVKRHMRGPFDRVYRNGILGKFYLSRAYDKYKQDIQRRIYDRLRGLT